MSIRKHEILKYKEYLKNLIYGVDIFLFDIGILLGKYIIIDPNIYTYFRVHGENTGRVFANQIDEWKRKQLDYLNNHVITFNIINQFIEDNFDLREKHVKLIHNYVKYEISISKIGIKLFQKNQKVSLIDLINVLRIYPKLIFVLFYLIDFGPSILKEIVIRKWFEKSLNKT
ncbi:hypothetical protein [Acidianus manzaensis]|uniref:Uncharacterized protein n=1 Tax=Acidianus manzaensis TaxID=282676 RepID=A0A1W6K3C3_9CREN|nr:hypothetical protein [Acidianus manzaensis]ARM76934.1 hypothetical protein B6F84_13515 [Acidianus manzaensis]